MGTVPPHPNDIEKSFPVPQGSGIITIDSISILYYIIYSITHIVVPSPPAVIIGSGFDESI